ncbi:hypothetical protein [Arthrobacter sp. AL12]|uniref:hypothetical protein n=1 Tax=Arthrobacter sp. AL12 TaxID=3042241 RepID=UPI00249AAD41|nr:hypothetical protein [Arthrobacter sp. AL12]MDI3213789.1 hypothetical protein [Arthrobacter sp. AL12]
MRLLKRLLRGPHERRPRHLDSCTECRLKQRRERQYLERLRGADVPVASDDLTARLLARTADLARNEPAGAPPAEDRGFRPARGFRPVRGFRPALRAAVLVVGTAAAAAALLGGSAFLVGGDRAVTAAGAPAPVFLQRDLAASGAASAVQAGPGAPTAWSLTGEPDFSPAGALTDEQLAFLRSEGWTCPELRELGYHLVWARAGVLAGGDILELRLTDGRNFATVLEQHGAQASSAPDSREQHGGVPGQSGSPGGGQNTAAPAPVNALTGRPATSDGFTAAGVPAVADATGGGAGAGRGTLWVHRAVPFAAIYQAGDVTFTYVSDQPAEQADDGVAALVRARAAAAGPAGSGGPGQVETVDGAGSNFTARLERGLGRIMELLAP